MVMDHLQLPNKLNFVATVLENWGKWRQIYTCIPWREGLIKKLRNHNPAFCRGAVFNIFQVEEESDKQKLQALFKKCEIYCA